MSLKMDAEQEAINHGLERDVERLKIKAWMESAEDIPPSVGKTAAHDSYKLYSLGPEMKEELIPRI